MIALGQLRTDFGVTIIHANSARMASEKNVFNLAVNCQRGRCEKNGADRVNLW
jgi:hypothetical protein